MAQLSLFFLLTIKYEFQLFHWFRILFFFLNVMEGCVDIENNKGRLGVGVVGDSDGTKKWP